MNSLKLKIKKTLEWMLFILLIIIYPIFIPFFYLLEKHYQSLMYKKNKKFNTINQFIINFDSPLNGRINNADVEYQITGFKSKLEVKVKSLNAILIQLNLKEKEFEKDLEIINEAISTLSTVNHIQINNMTFNNKNFKLNISYFWSYIALIDNIPAISNFYESLDL